MASQILEQRDGSTLFITINNPKKGNSLNVDLIVKLRQVIEDAGKDNTLIAIVLTGAGKYFCTGMDLSSSSSLLENVPKGADRSSTQAGRFEQLLDLFKVVEFCPKPIIALINGPCYGGGTGLAFACDIRISVSSAFFVLSEVRRGLTPAIISPFIVREWGAPLAREAMIQARNVPASELHAKGSVHYLVDTLAEGQERVQQVLKQQRGCAPHAVGESKRMVRNALDSPMVEERDAKIRELFLTMIKPNEEVAYGMKEFQAGNRNVDWAAWYTKKASSKL
ncbi:ClpP/crotonase-like domain-containing protein [Fusarium solani]|uniref:ClpP/crotonase-like domain-containing protein n=1 Tax=Fusarium solani TaxID=169388 RepID=A0A9P9KU16_FUSSL|nr:ClpP/crotonase-like domain-containing protein [Fusarium solani]KAH7268496.1 ClpP/crotonase-like domain-containing protein [Fusarium solani]